MADVCISKAKIVYLSRQLRYLDEIWFGNRLWPSEAVTSTNTKPEVVYSGSGRHLEKWIWRHISAIGAPIWTKFGSLMQNNMQITANWSRSKSEVELLTFHWESKMAAAAILNFREMSITLDWIQISTPKFMARCTTAMRRWPADQKSKPEVNSRDIKWMSGA